MALVGLPQLGADSSYHKKNSWCHLQLKDKKEYHVVMYSPIIFTKQSKLLLFLKSIINPEMFHRIADTLVFVFDTSHVQAKKIIFKTGGQGRCKNSLTLPGKLLLV